MRNDRLHKLNRIATWLIAGMAVTNVGWLIATRSTWDEIVFRGLQYVAMLLIMYLPHLLLGNLVTLGNFCNFAADLKSNKMKRTVFYILVFTLCSCAVQRATTGIEGMSELSVETLNTLTK